MCVLAILVVSVASAETGPADRGSAPSLAGGRSHGGALVALYPAVPDSPCCLQPSAMAGCFEGNVKGYEGDGPWPDVQDVPGALRCSCDRAWPVWRQMQIGTCIYSCIDVAGMSAQLDAMMHRRVGP